MANSMPTMKDVAREAGVAIGTVSKVFNNLPVGDEYRIRVEKAAKELGYQVNQYARGLRANKTYTVALILPGVHHPFFSALAQHICVDLSKRNHRMLLCVTESNPAIEQSCINMVRMNKADGIIALTYGPNLEIGDDLPFVSIDRHFNANVPCVASDNYTGGRIAAEKLLELGCKHLAFFRTGPVQYGEPDKRGDGFEQVCRSRGVDFETLRVNDSDQTPDVFREFLRGRMTDGKLDIDGIFCSTDQLALRIRSMLRDLGLRVPEDVQIIGFDGILHFDRDEYKCSTIVQPVERIAETCVDMLLSKDRSYFPALVCLPVTYAAGGTTKE